MHERLVTTQTVSQEELVAEIALQSRGGPNVEPQTAAMFGALLESCDPAIQSVLADAAENAALREIGCGPAVSGLRTTLVDYFRARSQEEGEEFSDALMLTPEDWKPAIDMLADDFVTNESNAIDSVHSGIFFREAATPVKERYASVAAVTQLLEERFPSGVRALSIGCSIMVGELQLMHSNEFPMSFETVTIGKRRHDVTEAANRLVQQPSLFNKIVGVDINAIYYEDRQRYDTDTAHYAISGLRPSERNNPEYFNVVKSLMSKMEKGQPGYTPDNGVSFHQGNLLDPVERDEFTDRFPDPFDVIIMSYVTQELPAEEQLRLHQVASQLVSHNGVIIYNHQAYVPRKFQSQPVDISRVRHYKSYATVPYSSAMHLVDMLHPGRGVQEAMKFHNNRCQRVRLGTAKLMVNGALEPIADLIKNS